MRTIIAGSRGIKSMGYVLDAVRLARAAGIVPTVVLCGDAQGIDRLGAQWAELNGIPVEHYPADWNTYGRSAGRARNVKMGLHAEALIAIWDGKSPGTHHMIETARRMGLKVSAYQVLVGV